MSRLLNKSTLRKLYEQKLFTTEYLATIEKVMQKDEKSDSVSAQKLKDFFIDLYFHRLENSEDYNEINKKVYDIFKVCSKKESDFKW